MRDFKFTWVSGVASLSFLSLVVFVLEGEPAGLFGLGQTASVILLLWVVGLAWTAVIVAYERARRQWLVRTARRDAVREVGQRTAEVAAHELTQPLTVVMAYAQWLRRGAANTEEQRHHLDQMVGACHEMAIILRELYDTIRHSRAQAGLTIVDELSPQEGGEADGDEDASEIVAALPGEPSAGGGPESAPRSRRELHFRRATP